MTEQDNHPDPYAPVWGEQNPGDDTRVVRFDQPDRGPEFGGPATAPRPIAAQNVVQPGQEIRYRDGKAEVVWSDPQAPPLWHTAAAYGQPRRPMPARRPVAEVRPEIYGPPPALVPQGAAVADPNGGSRFLRMSGGVLALSIAAAVLILCVLPVVLCFGLGFIGAVTPSPSPSF